MTNAKPISLAVRPANAAHLCFETDGVMAAPSVKLGSPVTAFDFDAFFSILSGTPTAPGFPWRLMYDETAIQTYTKPAAVAALRSEPQKIALRKALGARANAYFAKYGSIPDIIKETENFYDPALVNSKTSRLARLASISQQQAGLLGSAYANDGRMGVVKATNSLLSSQSVSSSTSGETVQSDDESLGALVDGRTPLGNLSGNPPLAGRNIQGVDSENAVVGEGSSSSSSFSKANAEENQTIASTDYAYRVPALENQAQLERAQISLMDEQYNHFMKTLNLGWLEIVLTEEAKLFDWDVSRLQLAYLGTFLLSPISGTVTGVYKQPGEAVRAGETVIRVEDNSTVLLVAGLVCESPVTLGATLTVTTRLFGGSAATVSLSGPVVSARGRPESDNHWEVIASIANLDADGKPILPLGYHFNREDTAIVVS